MRSPFDIAEVLDRIIDHLHEDDDDLRSCALVAKRWLPSSRFHLFRTTVIDSEEDLEWLSRQVRQNPSIGAVIRTLELVDPFSDGVAFAKLIAITHATPTLAELILDTIDWDGPGVGTLTPLTCGSSIRSVAIVNCSFEDRAALVGCLQAFPRLDNLSIESTRFWNMDNWLYDSSDEEDADAPVQVHRRISVDQLDMAYISMDKKATVLDILDSRSPRVVRFSCSDPQELRDMRRFCAGASAQIEEVHVAIGMWEELIIDEESFNPFEMPALRKLSFSLIKPDDEDPLGRSADLILAFNEFASAFRAPKIELVELDLAHVAYQAPNADLVRRVDWKRARNALREVRGGTEYDGFPRVDVIFHAHTQDTKVVQAVQRGLRELELQGMVHYVYKLLDPKVCV